MSTISASIPLRRMWHQQSVMMLATAGLICSNLMAGTATETLRAYLGTRPTIDGTISSGEWADASTLAGVSGWKEDCNRTPVGAADLSATIYVKHDNDSLYFAFDIRDSVMYAFDCLRWTPDGEPNVNDLTRTAGWPFFGDGVEIMLHPEHRWTSYTSVLGNGRCWKVACSTHKSLVGGLGVAGFSGAEPRSDSLAWERQLGWFRNGQMRCGVRLKTVQEGRGFVIEWAIAVNPCLEVAPGVFYNPAVRDTFGLNIEIEDLDRKAEGNGCWANYRHIAWWAGSNKELISTWPKLIMEPGPNPLNPVRKDAVPATKRRGLLFSPGAPSVRICGFAPEMPSSITAFSLSGAKVSRVHRTSELDRQPHLPVVAATR